ncbi:MAG: 1-acyl-sn-glycerol-3-phosphate acyltransferase [Amaricoccus sp.]|uniref:1-acyl-sn-glycerol-3-phosphate acyltransferase n=1 Tax=Amaricoccus sp. TaxID=1872485 RepID=UPI0039E58140
MSEAVKAPPRARWSGAVPPVLPPLTGRERARLGFRLVWAVAALVFFFGLFLLARAVDWLVERLAGRPASALGPAVVQVWAAQALASLGLAYVQRGEPMRSGGAFVANHSSWIDIWALQRAAAPFLVSKAEVRDWPGVGLIGRAIGTMFIDRRPAQAKAQEAELLARLARGDRMAIFPEGTSTDGQRILAFKSALFGVFFAPELAGQVAVQPVTIRYRPPEGLPAAVYGWWGEMDFAGHLRDVLARSAGGTVELTFRAPLRPEAFGGRKEMAAAAEAAVRAGFGA